MEYSPVAEKTYTHTGTFSLADFSAECDEQRLDIPPRNVAAGWMVENQSEGSFVSAFHIMTVPFSGIISKE